jgi:hypothetical protein
LNSHQGTEPKGMSRPSRGADGLQCQPLKTQAAVGNDVPAHEDAVGVGPTASWEVPEGCQQFGCREPVATWCPLCEKYLCASHDELRVERRHDCLGGRADV